MLSVYHALLPVLDVCVPVRVAAVKYAKLSQLPLRPRVAVCGLYLIAIGLVTAAGWIAADGTSGYLMALCWVAQVSLLMHLIRRA
jgi:hypothetical protein